MPTEKEIYDKAVGPWEREVCFKAIDAGRPERRKKMIERLKKSAIFQMLLKKFPEIKKIRVETEDTAYEIRRRGKWDKWKQKH